MILQTVPRQPALQRQYAAYNRVFFPKRVCPPSLLMEVCLGDVLRIRAGFSRERDAPREEEKAPNDKII